MNDVTKAPLLNDLSRAVAEFEEATAEAHAGRREHVGASSELQVVADDALELVGVLDALARYRFKDDSELQRQWKSVRNIVGPFRSRSDTPEVGKGQTPPLGGIAPAA